MDISAPRTGALGLGLVKTPIRHVDPMLILTSIALSVFGLFMIYSASHTRLEQLDQDPAFFVKKQVTYLFAGLIVLLLTASFDYRLVKVYAVIGFALMVGLLFVVLLPVIGTRINGAQRWISVLGFDFQPSEPAKLGLIAMLAAYLSEVKGGLGLREVLRAAAITAIPMGLAFIQPDVGTSLVFAATLVGILLVASARPRHLAVLALVAAFALFAGLQTGLVKEYQIERLRTFLDDEADPQRAGYNKAQSEIAIGNGGMTGQGYLNGSQTNLDFVPAQHTDFIFTVVGEEFGFVGAVGMLLIFGFLLWRGLRIALLSKEPFGRYLATGIVTMFAFMTFVNVGMTMGIMPVTGIPLPFMSYGGTALVTNFFAVGLLLNIHMRRFK
ncbi:MAG: rod shape-determining protein RodA, partial [Actinobacteria bacterium]|nr:rod shape-determining protein RodA [Actinomycetota bacterium]